ncbi:MAG: hypothetical protein AAGG48_09825 [Planctomycetota bacterium]
MKRASRLFSDEQRQRIDAAVASAESKTSAELVPVVATMSGRYDRAEDIIGFWCSIAAVVITLPFLWTPESTTVGDWGAPTIALRICVLVIAMVLAFVFGVYLGSRTGWLRRLFTPTKEMRDDVDASARKVFFDQRIHHTNEGVGMLFYISLYERVATIIADQRVMERLGQPVLDQLCTQLTTGLRNGDYTDTLCSVLDQAGGHLQDVLPRDCNDRNELSDSLVTID